MSVLHLLGFLATSVVPKQRTGGSRVIEVVVGALIDSKQCDYSF